MEETKKPAVTPGRFEYVKYDDHSTERNLQIKGEYERLDALISKQLPEGRSKSLALTALEESFMWVGKAIRDEQVQRLGRLEP